MVLGYHREVGSASQGRKSGFGCYRRGSGRLQKGARSEGAAALGCHGCEGSKEEVWLSSATGGRGGRKKQGIEMVKEMVEGKGGDEV